MKAMSDLIGKRVQIYPGDSDIKIGIIEFVNPQGVMFKITTSQSKSYKQGALHFISYSANLSFEVMEDN